ncbi:MAG: seryl-tRNA synthetase [Microgenomates group bacterium Gr01-1014_16]|nr:MAG: seryl-tRNA synthetase [Microgenomates group bacterium Gr01-1014_16]
MIDIKLIRDNPDKVKAGITAKGLDPKLVDEVVVLDKKHRELIGLVEALHAARNKLTKDQIDEGKKIKIQLKELEPQLSAAELASQALLLQIPNMPSPLAPTGKSEKDNVEVRKWGEPRKFDFKPLDHLELGEKLKILDFPTGAKVSGSQFYFLYGDGALLELALVRYAFDLLSKEGFLPVITPDLAKARYYLGTGYAPKGSEAQTYTIQDEDLGLIATAEVTLAGKHADEIIPQDKLPIKYIGYSHCFRQEAGAYGKYSKGLYRVHEFTKAEMFIYCLPEESEKMHLHILDMEEKIYQNLGLPYRVLEMCTGDLGAMAARKFDIEAWMPTRDDYGEVTSTSNCTDYQARNLNIKFKRKTGEIEFIHMLNGTAVATSRTAPTWAKTKSPPESRI